VRAWLAIFVVACHAQTTADAAPAATTSAVVSASPPAPSAASSAAPKAAITRVTFQRDTMTGRDRHRIEIDPTSATIDGVVHPIDAATFRDISQEIDASTFPYEHDHVFCRTDQPQVWIKVTRGVQADDATSNCPEDAFGKLYERIVAKLPK